MLYSKKPLKTFTHEVEDAIASGRLNAILRVFRTTIRHVTDAENKSAQGTQGQLEHSWKLCDFDGVWAECLIGKVCPGL